MSANSPPNLRSFLSFYLLFELLFAAIPLVILHFTHLSQSNNLRLTASLFLQLSRGFVTYFSKFTTIALLSSLQHISVSAAAVGGSISKSYDSLPKPIISPYYLYFGNPATSRLADAFDTLDLRSVTVGFASAPHGSCGLTPDLNNLLPDIHAFVGKGGAISLSFGGNMNDQTIPRQHIQQACRDVPSLTTLILRTMRRFKTHNLDFDIEDATLLNDSESAARLAQALAQVKKAVPDVYITYTVGCLADGMPLPQLAYVLAAKQNGLTIDSLILMTMNMGGTDNVADAQTAILGGAAQLAFIYGISTADATKMMGMAPAIGVDNNHHSVSLDGIATLRQFAAARGMTILSYWSFNRDFPGGDPAANETLSSSSSPDQTRPAQFLTTLLDGVAPAPAPAPASGSAAALDAVPPPPTHRQPAQKPPNPPFCLAALPGSATGAANATHAGRHTLDVSTPSSGLSATTLG